MFFSLQLSPWNIETCLQDLVESSPITITLISSSTSPFHLFSSEGKKALATRLGASAKLQYLEDPEEVASSPSSPSVLFLSSSCSSS
jgi:hypothetical protein